MTQPPVIRTTLLDQRLTPDVPIAHAEVRRIEMAANVVAGAHRHNGDVVGTVLRGSVMVQVEGDSARLLTVGDVFFEPANRTILRFDAQGDGAVFLGWFLLGDGVSPELEQVPAP